VTAIAVRSAPAPRQSHARRRRLSIAATDDREVLLRVLIVLRRRGFTVLAVDYEAGDAHRPTVLSLTVESTARTAHQLEAWLANVVGVLAVDDIT
jgi:acetolactate synthase regulatory subunit